MALQYILYSGLPVFVLGQDESQRTTTEIEGWSKVKLPIGWTRVNLAFYIEYGYSALHNRIISVLYITMSRTRPYTICDISD